MIEFFESSALRTVTCGTLALGVVSGALGCFAVLRRQSLVGDAVSHACLPGLGLAFLVFGKAPLLFVVGAGIVGWLATIVVFQIVRATRVPFDAALGGVLAVFFGLGLVLMTWIQKNVPGAGEVGLERYLVGQAATMHDSDVWVIVGVGTGALLIMCLFWKEFKVLSFDPGFAISIGMPVRFLELLLSFLLVLAIVVGLQSVGVVLMSALLVAPAVAARQWTDRLGTMVVLAGGLGGISGAAGTLISDALSKPGEAVPTGPTIVLCVTFIVAVSFVLPGLLRRPRVVE
jgi:manganese/zinc/iron transport system permease protein